jgi:hypothetical protein
VKFFSSFIHRSEAWKKPEANLDAVIYKSPYAPDHDVKVQDSPEESHYIEMN